MRIDFTKYIHSKKNMGGSLSFDTANNPMQGREYN